ncbi:MAG: hypothetical protein WA667_30615 [Candidatus Nitrosopolaris sp.]
MSEFLLRCSGWNYPDTPDKSGWTRVFYPDKDNVQLSSSDTNFIRK